MACQRVDSSSGWRNRDDWRLVSGWILPVGGSFGIVSGWFVGGLFQRLGDLGLRCASGETLAGRCAGGLG